MDYAKIVAQHAATGADVTIAAIPFPTSKVEGLGLMRVNDDLSIAEFVEKPKDPAVINSLTLSPTLEARLRHVNQGEKHCLASMGIYVFNRGILNDSLANTMTDFGKEVIPGLLAGRKLYAHIFEGYWEDIGTVKAFFDANLALAQPLPPFNFFDEEDPIYTTENYLPASKVNKCSLDYAVIGDGSIIEDSFIRHSVIGIRSFVRNGCHLEDVVMMGADFYETPDEMAANEKAGRPNIGLGYNCRISGAIIDKNARIGNNVKISPCNKADGTYAHGVMIRDGVVVVPKGCTVPGDTVI
jgi:glucose-1-phosphate adenylyltransferase